MRSKLKSFTNLGDDSEEDEDQTDGLGSVPLGSVGREPLGTVGSSAKRGQQSQLQCVRLHTNTTFPTITSPTITSPTITFPTITSPTSPPLPSPPLPSPPLPSPSLPSPPYHHLPYHHLPYRHLPYHHLPYRHLPYHHLPTIASITSSQAIASLSSQAIVYLFRISLVLTSVWEKTIRIQQEGKCFYLA